jgi:FeS assembly SUF system protein
MWGSPETDEPGAGAYQRWDSGPGNAESDALDAGAMERMREQIVAALRKVQDPELPVNIYDLGLIYRLDISHQGDVAIEMTLTAPSCPVAGTMPIMVRNAVIDVDGVGVVHVDLVWEPPWTKERMSEAARLECDML